MTTPCKESGAATQSLGRNPPTAEPTRPARIKVVLVDDDDDFREAAAAELEYFEFEVTAFADGDAMLASLAQGQQPDVIVLDWHLPRRLGIELLRALQAQGSKIPVVILTGNPEIAYEAAAFDDGAYDFVDKARGMSVLARRISRIAAPAEAAAVAPENSLTSGRLLLDLQSSRGYWDDRDLNLTVTEFNIVRLLVDRADAHVTYRAIYDCVHHPGFLAGDGEDGYRTNVRSAIRRIRDKFRIHDVEFSQIENFAAFGYRWRADPVDP